MRRIFPALAISLQAVLFPLSAQASGADSTVDRTLVQRMLETGLQQDEAFALLRELTSRAGHRLSGSAGAAKAVELTRQMMLGRGFDGVRLEPLMVPHWERGAVEKAVILSSPPRKAIPLSVCALGGSIATPAGGITAEVVEVKSFDELHRLGAAAKGKIIFFNRAMDPSRFRTFEAYGGAVDQRARGAIEAAAAGGVAAVVRSMTLALDDIPHTGAMAYVDTLKKVPAAAVSTLGAEKLSALLRGGPSVRLRLILACRTFPDAPSANVMGEIRGTEQPEEIIVVGGHLDCWDKGTGAHDDGAGCMQAIEAVNLIKKLGLRPHRTIRAVMFMNEENGSRGGKEYASAPSRTAEKHVAAIESDAGGFAPRGISVQGDSLLLQKVLRWKPLFDLLDAGKIDRGHSGVDVSPIVAKGVPGFGLIVENHRYFDYHHSANDTLDKVNPRELEMGAIVEALLCYLISEEGL